MMPMPNKLKILFETHFMAAGEYYSVQQLVDQNYATQTGAYYTQDIFIKDIINGLADKFLPPFEMFVACENDDIVGFIITETNNGKLWINNIFVKNQNNGVGKQLFDFVTRFGGRKPQPVASLRAKGEPPVLRR